MRRILALLIALIIVISLFTFVPVFAMASSANYLRINTDNVSLYADRYMPDTLFILPKTFYVKVIQLNYGSDYHIVEYNGVRGLVKISEIGSETVSDIQNPYFTSQTITAHVQTYLYTSPSFAAKTEIPASGLSLTYLGKVNGDTGSYDTPIWFAVLYANELYYLHCSATNNLGLLESTFAPVHPNSVIDSPTTETGTSTTDPSSEEEEGVDLLRVLLIAGMIIPILIIFFLLFKPKKRPAPTRRRDRRYPDEDDYDDDYYAD